MTTAFVTALAAVAVTPLLCGSLAAQTLGMRAAVVPGRTEVLVSAGSPGWLIGLLLGEQEGAFTLPGGNQLSIVPLVLAQIGFADSRGDWLASAQFPVGSAAGLGFFAQAVAVDLNAAAPETAGMRMSSAAHLRVPELDSVANVFILFGQSNAEGYADLHALPPELLAPVPEARVWNELTGSWQALLPGTNNTTLQNPNWCGPEITLATSLVESGEVVYLVKFAVGQTALGPTPGPWNEWGYAANELYGELMRRFDNACFAIRQAKMRPVVRGICMMQGESDALYPALAAQYQVLLDALVRGMRGDLVNRGVMSTPDVPFVIGLINRDLIPAGFPHVDTVREAQNEVIASLPQLRAIDTTGLPLNLDGVHFATAGQMSLGTSMANELMNLSVITQLDHRGVGGGETSDDRMEPWKIGLIVGGALVLIVLCLIFLRRLTRGRTDANLST